MLAVIFRMRYLVNTTHKAKCKNGAIRLKSKRKFRGVQLASAGYYLSHRTIKVFEPLRPLYQATHLLKITAHLLLTYYSISYIFYSWLFWYAFINSASATHASMGTAL